MVKVLAEESLNTEFPPVRDRDTHTCETISHSEVLFLEESVEGRGLWDINGIHGLIREAEDLGAFEADYLTGESLLTGRHLTGLDE